MQPGDRRFLVGWISYWNSIYIVNLRQPWPFQSLGGRIINSLVHFYPGKKAVDWMRFGGVSPSTNHLSTLSTIDHSCLPVLIPIPHPCETTLYGPSKWIDQYTSVKRPNLQLSIDSLMDLLNLSGMCNAQRKHNSQPCARLETMAIY